MAPQMLQNVNVLAGPELLGAFLAWGLQGVLTLQCYMYYTWFSQDRFLVKLLVWATFVWEWVQIGLVTQTFFDIWVYDYGNLDSLTSFHNTWFSVTIMTSVVSLVVQCFFSWRIWVLSRSKVLMAMILFLSFAQMAIGTAGGVIIVVIGANAAQANLNGIVISVSAIIVAVDDVIIAGSMAYPLLRSKSGIKQSDAMVHKLVRLGIETGATTAVVALLNAVLIMTYRENLLFASPSLVLPKLYSNSLLVSLNNRAFIAQSDASFEASLRFGGSSIPQPASQSRTLLGHGASAVGAHDVHVDVQLESHPEHNVSKNGIELVQISREEPSGTRSFSE